MDYNLLTPTPLRPGWGLIYQGGSPDDQIRQIPGPLVLICMRENENYDRFIDSKHVYAVIVATIMDVSEAVLPDTIYVALMKSAFAHLKRGINLYIHCAAGHSRSSYLTVGMFIRALDLPLNEALSLVRSRRPSASPNEGFQRHLSRLESRLRQGSP